MELKNYKNPGLSFFNKHSKADTVNMFSCSVNSDEMTIIIWQAISN